MSNAILDILSLPSEGDSPITSIDYRRRQSGVWGAAYNSGRDSPFVGPENVDADEGDAYQWRCVNATGAGNWSDTKVIEAAPTPIDDLQRETDGTVTVNSLAPTDDLLTTRETDGTVTVNFSKTYPEDGVFSFGVAP